MVNGRHGDEPYLDITEYHLRVFSESADRLIRQLSVLMNSGEIITLRAELMRIPANDRKIIVQLEQRLAKLKEKLTSRAVESGWDLELIQERLAKEE